VGRATVANRLDIRQGRRSADADSLQLSQSVAPMSGASMRILETLIACAALATAVLIGVGR
jgi:hypothetical protein